MGRHEQVANLKAEFAADKLRAVDDPKRCDFAACAGDVEKILADGGALTISGGSVTVTASYHSLK